MKSFLSLNSIAILWLVAFGSVADELAGPESPEEAENEESNGDPGDEDNAFLTDTEKAEIEPPAQEKNIGRREDPKQPLFSVGARVRWLMIPEWFIKMFGVSTATTSSSKLPLVSNVGVGPEFTYRKDGFDITAAIWYAGLSFSRPISFKEKGEDNDSWEVVENDLKAILITADFLWSTSITDWFAITYGAGLGLGIPFPKDGLKRTEARTDIGDPIGTVKCKTVEEGTRPGCGKNEEYEESYDKLKVIPWINFLVGTRFKPHRHVAIYVDGGFGLGFQVGTRVGYIF